MILVSNDDGIHSEGLRALSDAMGSLDEVLVVAPDRERSAASHSLTLHRPLRVEQIRAGWFAVDGTPTDCVLRAVCALRRAARLLRDGRGPAAVHAAQRQRPRDAGGRGAPGLPARSSGPP